MVGGIMRIMRRAWQAPNGGHRVRRSSLEGIRERAPARVQKHDMARSWSYGVLGENELRGSDSAPYENSMCLILSHLVPISVSPILLSQMPSLRL